MLATLVNEITFNAGMFFLLTVQRRQCKKALHKAFSMEKAIRWLAKYHPDKVVTADEQRTYLERFAVTLADQDRIQDFEQRSADWLRVRQGRLTASNFGAAIGFNYFCRPSKLLERMLWETFKGNAACDYGIANEPVACDIYERYIREKHPGAEVKFEYPGLVVPLAYPFLGCSPDGITNIDGERILLEIKCPFRKKMYPKIPPYYYCQVQGIAGLLGFDKIHFVTMTPEQTRIEEYAFKDKKCIFEQREVGIDVISFESALSHALRQDPDVIVVGEMRDRRSLESAVAASDTGHLVMSTLHTANAGQSITRILDMYPHEERDAVRKALAENIAAIVCQRLAPRASGKGVVPVNEILVNTGTIKKLIIEDKIDKIHNAIEAGKEMGMFSFDQRLLELVNEGLITEEVALEKANNPESLTMNLRGIFLGTDNSILG